MNVFLLLSDIRKQQTAYLPESYPLFRFHHPSSHSHIYFPIFSILLQITSISSLMPKFSLFFNEKEVNVDKIKKKIGDKNGDKNWG